MPRFCIQSTISLLTVWISFEVSLNARIGHSFSIWEIVCDSHTQSQKKVMYSFHLWITWLHLSWPARKRFRVAQIFLSRSKPGCLVIGLVSKFYLSGFLNIQSFCHLVFTSKFSNNNSFAVIQRGLRDLSRSLPSNALRSLCIVWFVFLVILVHYRIRACSLRIFGEAIITK